MFDGMPFILDVEVSDFSISLTIFFWCLRNFLTLQRFQRFQSQRIPAALAMVLWMIGLGLGDEGDISVKGLKAVQRMLDLRHVQYCYVLRDCIVLEYSLTYHWSVGLD